MIAVAACELQREPTAVGPLDVPPAVHAILRAGDDTVRVAITGARFPGFGNSTEVEPVSGADVRIHGPFGSVVLQEAAPGMGQCLRRHEDQEPGVDAEPGCYVQLLPEAVQAGERYGLSITLPTGEVVTGETHVPTPATLSLESGGRVVVDADSVGGQVMVRVGLEWSRAPDAVALEFSLLQVAAFAGGETAPAVACGIGFDMEPRRTPAAAGTGEVRVFHISCFKPIDPEDPFRLTEVAWDSIAAVVQVAAADSAYAFFEDSIRTADALPWPRAAVGLEGAVGPEGAVGVFGAVAVTEVPLVLIRAKD